MAIKNTIAFTTVTICLSMNAFAQEMKKNRWADSDTKLSTESINERKASAAPASTLADVYESALAKNLPFLMNDRNYQAMVARIQQAESRLKPQVYGEVRAGFYDNGNLNQTAHNYLSSSASINATWILYNKELKLGVNVAELEAQLAERQLTLARQELMGMVARSYLDLVSKDDQVQFAEEKVSSLKKLYRSTQSLIQIGVQTPDLLGPINIDMKRAEIKVLEAKQALNTAQSKFLSDYGISYTPTLSARNIVIPAVNKKNKDQWLMDVEDNSLKIQIQKVALELALKSVDKAHAVNGATLYLEGRAGVDRNPIYAGTFQQQEQSQFQRGNSLFLRLNVPFWDGGYRSGVTKEYLAKAETAELQLELANKQAHDDAVQAIEQYKVAISTINTQRQIIGVSQELIRTLQAQGQSGQVNFERMLLESGRLYENKYELSLANIRALDAYIQLKLATSELNANDLAMISSSLQKKPIIPNAD